MFNKILFATSTEKTCDHAARVAFNIGHLYNAHIDIFHVVDPFTGSQGQVTDDAGTSEQITAEIRQKIESRYAEQLPKARSHAVKIASGPLDREMLAEIQASRPNLLVLGERFSGQPDRKAVSREKEKAVQRIARESACPVLFVNRPAASFWGAISNVVFATDFSNASEAAFAFACKLTRHIQCELHIFHVQTMSLTPESEVFNQDDIEHRIREKLRFFRKKYVSRMQGIDRYAIEVWEGEPYVEIVKYAREKYADLIIMAKDSKNPRSETEALGSNTRQVILRAGCPVLCINRA
ncbi:MAG TPA: universal stress protein [Desulfobacteraceae bacterium]|nr:universal stress protein [Desulfobacteraceae bacterium]